MYVVNRLNCGSRYKIYIYIKKLRERGNAWKHCVRSIILITCLASYTNWGSINFVAYQQTDT